MKGNDTKNKKIIMCMLVAVVIFKIMKVKAQNAAPMANACLNKKRTNMSLLNKFSFILQTCFT